MYALKSVLGYSVREIEELDVRTGVEQLNRHYEERLQDRIQFLGAHGYDVTDVSAVGTELYRNYINAKRAEIKKNNTVVISEEEAEATRKMFEEEKKRLFLKRKFRRAASA